MLLKRVVESSCGDLNIKLAFVCIFFRDLIARVRAESIGERVDERRTGVSKIPVPVRCSGVPTLLSRGTGDETDFTSTNVDP